MLKIKKINFILFPFIVIGIVFISISWKINTNSNTNKVKIKKAVSYFEDKPDFFWFSVRIQIDSKTNTFKMVGATGGISHGQQIDFEKDLWRGLSRRQIVVGPFESRREAVNAKIFYKSKESKIKLSSLKDFPDQTNSFALKLRESPRLGIFIIERNPASVFTKSTKDFISFFYTSLNQRLITIGPFENYDQAEFAKRLYRANE